MQTVNAHKYTSHLWAPGYRYLDSDVFVAELKLTPRKQVAAPQDYDEGGTYLQYTRVPKNVDTRLAAEALRDTMGGSNCQHEYDCCGCATRHVSVKVLGSRRLRIRTHISLNY
jgi:hypothetical protein